MAQALRKTDLIPIGEMARRTGLSVSAIRFYEDKKLVEPVRTGGNQRRFLRSDIRRVSFIRIAQQLGLTLGEIEAEFSKLPHGRTPTARDWQGISKGIRGVLDAKIAELQRTRDALDGCIGCGCLSLKKCAIYNDNDHLAEKGPGPRQLIAD
ncbi:redox-sensitive transcriptional activator SoxR [Erythrobacter sp. F6033]|uniref:redox-sensitive transcriptional activator SoxR n=1 Tax=Erythrobacter sp. F6033 TaxID=2926401 RepID=UPI001FF169F5|nr:redox-sensitive transcriptional activator SoxR [Erythrobacter sp. F6033]MCK0128776.1 redox-sensitive transcriptional activator SoxR [Erythrobacter sp. F6033]